MSYARGWHHTSYNRKKHCANRKTLQLCLDRISVWCNTNHMLINPVKTKSMVITTRQKYQLSDLSMRLSLDGQNIENVTEHRLLGLIVDNKFRWQAQIEHICKSMSKKLFFLNCNISSTSTPDLFIFYNRSHKNSHRIRVSSVGRLWRSTLKTNWTPYIEGQAN